MKKATTLFTSDEISSIEAAITIAENDTSAEVVPVVASVSGRYDRSEDSFGFLFSLVALGLSWSWLHGLGSSGEGWESAQQTLNLPIVLCILIGAFIIGIALASRLSFLRLPFISKREMQEDVERSARESFQKLKIHNTENSTGILIYVSLFEHRVQVVGDEAINEKLSQSDWDELRDIVISGFKSGNPADGMRKGILHAGELLAKHFPISADDQNELHNTLHLID